MTGNGEESKKPAKYPETDSKEHSAVDTLNYILDPSVKSYIDSRDKAPNHDGWVEIVDDDGVPLGRLVVQVKKLPGGAEDDPKIQMETRHLSYCYVPIEPFVLILVDTTNEIAYWRHISKSWFNELELSQQGSKIIHFGSDSQIEKGESQYVEDWLEIIETTRKRVEDYDEYLELKRHSNPAIGKSKQHYRQVHAFLDAYHTLLDGEFEAVKNGLYPNIWKLGFGIIEYENSELRYTLYPIEEDENDAQIREIEANWDVVHQLGSDHIFGRPRDNPLESSPSKFAYNIIEKQVEDAVDNRQLDYSDTPFLATEYLFSFVDKYTTILGLDDEDSYEVSDIRDGYYRYLQHWISADLGSLVQDSRPSNVHVDLDGYIEMEATAHQDERHEIARERTDKIDSDPPQFQIIARNFEQQIIERLLDNLGESDVDIIERPYHGRDRDTSDWDEAQSVLDFYSDEAIFKNIQRYHSNYWTEYRNLVKCNFPLIEDDLIEEDAGLLVVEVDTEMERESEGGRRVPTVTRYWLKTGEAGFNTEVAKKEDIEIEVISEPPQDEWLAKYDGAEYPVVRQGMGGGNILFDIDSDRKPMMDAIHRELSRSLRDYLADKTLGFPDS